MTLYVNVQHDDDDEIGTLCQEAVLVSRQTGLVVRFTLNGETIDAYSDSDPVELVRGYKTAIARRSCANCGRLDCMKHTYSRSYCQECGGRFLVSPEYASEPVCRCKGGPKS